jgi:hypothetical protein
LTPRDNWRYQASSTYCFDRETIVSRTIYGYLVPFTCKIWRRWLSQIWNRKHEQTLKSLCIEKVRRVSKSVESGLDAFVHVKIRERTAHRINDKSSSVPPNGAWITRDRIWTKRRTKIENNFTKIHYHSRTVVREKFHIITQECSVYNVWDCHFQTFCR